MTTHDVQEDLKLYASLTGVSLMHRNFRGRETKFGRGGDPAFSMVLTKYAASDLTAKGWLVRQIRFADGRRVATLRVHIHRYFMMDRITLNGVSLSDKSDLSILDYDSSLLCDISLVGQPWKVDTREGIKTYLTALDAVSKKITVA